MSARDRYHEEFRTALENEGWVITDDPFYVGAGGTNVQIDIGAERLIIAEKETERIAVEIKTFGHLSFVTNMYDAVGQYICYRYILSLNNLDRILFLAMPIDVYGKNEHEPIMGIFNIEHIHLVLYEAKTETIKKWIKQADTKP